MKILKPELAEVDGGTAVRARVVSRLGDSWLHYAVPKGEESALASDVSDAFLMGLLPVAMSVGEDVETVGPVSATLLFNLDHGLKHVLGAQVPTLKIGRVHAEGTGTFAVRGDTVATGISGRVDSSHVIAEYHLSPDVPDTLRVRQLLFFNVGSNGERNDDRARAFYSGCLQRVRLAADRVGLPQLTVDSNLADFYEKVGMNHQLTATAPSVSAALAVQARVSRYLLASGPTWARSGYGPSATMEFTDPYYLPLCRTERFDTVSVGGELKRGEKIERLVKHQFVRDFLRPCTSGLENCGRCGKCKGTLLPLEIIGVLPEFNRVFDLEKWASVREEYVAEVRRRRFGPRREMADFAEAHGYSLSVSLRARIRQRWKEVWEWLRQLKREPMVALKLKSSNVPLNRR